MPSLPYPTQRQNTSAQRRQNHVWTRSPPRQRGGEGDGKAGQGGCTFLPYRLRSSALSTTYRCPPTWRPVLCTALTPAASPLSANAVTTSFISAGLICLRPRELDQRLCLGRSLASLVRYDVASSFRWYGSAACSRNGLRAISKPQACKYNAPRVPITTAAHAIRMPVGCVSGKWELDRTVKLLDVAQTLVPSVLKIAALSR